MIDPVLVTIYAVGFFISAFATVVENHRHPTIAQIPNVAIFLLSLFWPIIFAVNIVALLRARRRQ